MNSPAISKSIFICAALVQAAGAVTIVQSSGNSGASVPLGFYAPYDTSTVFTVSWNQTSAYTGVDIFANLFSPGGGAVVDYTLTTALGPGTTFAQDGIIRGSVATPANPTDLDLITLPQLGPGTYYLTLDVPSGLAAWQYNYPFQSNYTLAPGVTFLGEQQAQFTNIDNTYTAASTFSGIGYPVEFAVTGTPTPEPNLAGIFALLAIAAALRMRAGKQRA